MTAVAVPALSRLQNDPDRYRRFYLKAIKNIAYVSMPLIAVMGVLSDEIVNIVLGEGWTDAAMVFSVLAVAAIWSPIASTVGWIYVSLDQTRRGFLWTCIMTPITLGAFMIGLNWGPVGVAASYTVLVVLQIVPQFWFALRYSPVSLADVAVATRNPVIASLTLAMGLALVRHYLVSHGQSAVLLGCSAGAGAILLLQFACSGGIRQDVRGFVDVAAIALRRSGRCAGGGTR